jgi:preprotein translocase subunit SecE
MRPHPPDADMGGTGGRTIASRFGVCAKGLRQAMAKVSPGEFVNQVKTEASKIVWPTGRETIMTGVMVVIMTTLLGLFFFGIDTFFGAIVQWLLGLAAGQA